LHSRAEFDDQKILKDLREKKKWPTRIAGESWNWKFRRKK
jgi:hypothetical protein